MQSRAATHGCECLQIGGGHPARSGIDHQTCAVRKSRYDVQCSTGVARKRRGTDGAAAGRGRRGVTAALVIFEWNDIRLTWQMASSERALRLFAAQERGKVAHNVLAREYARDWKIYGMVRSEWRSVRDMLSRGRIGAWRPVDERGMSRKLQSLSLETNKWSEIRGGTPRKRLCRQWAELAASCESRGVHDVVSHLW